jgi:Spy/CpxP family protein refolding chaperone
MKTLKLLTIVAITGLASTVAVNACPSNGLNKQKCETKKMCKKNKGQRGDMREIFQKLDLTAEQQSAMKENHQVIREQRKEKRAQKHVKRGMADMNTYVSANGFDKEAFIEKAMQKAEKRIRVRAETFESTMNILTPEQRVKFVTLLQERQK